ncbi:conserved hypothetical protein [Altererythrobacter sp. B11]|uniref:DMT family transporter n=1 Tax=Altererythrobacter sp. B11 TaxID=2060312 RepID=UPI000DC7220B|nr:DMT family transporter [Altererythrobacter sp. B11]BBC73717.1 conserved hypothetical protein [Altererythrobacter sp. B11]
MQQSDRAGLLYALAGFSTLSIGDAIVKSMAGLWPPTAMGATRYVLAAIGLCGMLAAREGVGALFRMPKARIQWVRGLSVCFATFGMFTAVWLMPLAEATTITFTQPMITALLAVLILGERLRPVAVLCTLAAFVGVVIVLRPNFAVVGWAVLFPLLAASSMAMLMIANRAAAHSASVLAMQAYIAMTASVFLVIATVLGHLSGLPQLQMHWPDWTVLARCAFIAVSASVAHWLIYMGTAKAGAATVAPMTYGQLLVASVIGWFFFNEAPDAISLLGAAIIIGAGLVLWAQGKVRQPPEGV